MKLDVYIKPTHEVVIFPMSCVGAYGVISEDNSIILNMHFPENLIEADLSTVEKELVVTTSKGSFCYPLIKETFELPAEVMSDIVIKLQIKVSAKSFTWKTFPFILRLKEGLDESGDNVYEPVVTAAREKCRAELAESLEKTTKEEQSSKSWEELTDDVSKLIIVDEEKQEKLDGFDMVRYSVENADIGRTGNYAIATQGLFTTAPVNESGFNVEFSLPYFNTSKAKWEYVEGTNSVRRDYFSPYLKEIGLDCTSAVNFATYRCKASIFEYMEKLKLTNVSCPLDGAFKRCANLNVLEIYGTDGVLKPKELTHTFYECNELIEINGDELDLSDLTSATLAFYGCYILQYIRFKPFTLKVSLDLGDCRYINIKAHSFPSVMDFGTLISLLNAIPEPEGNDNSDITITLNKGIEESLSMAYVIKDEETHLYKYNPEPEVITSWGFLYDAFLMKGVTLAWKN